MSCHLVVLPCLGFRAKRGLWGHRGLLCCRHCHQGVLWWVGNRCSRGHRDHRGLCNILILSAQLWGWKTFSILFFHGDWCRLNPAKRSSKTLLCLVQFSLHHSLWTNWVHTYIWRLCKFFVEILVHKSKKIFQPIMIAPFCHMQNLLSSMQQMLPNLNMFA